MKLKRSIVILLALALLFVLVGCAVEEKLDALEDRLENRADIAENAMASNPSRAAASTSATMLTKEQAEQIALEYAGLSADQVSYLHTKYEIDDGIPQYDVEFHEGAWEYEFEIHAETGKILSYDKDDR